MLVCSRVTAEYCLIVNIWSNTNIKKTKKKKKWNKKKKDGKRREMMKKTAKCERENGPAAVAVAFTTIDDKNQLRSPPHYVCTVYTTSRLTPAAAEFCLFRFTDARFYDLPAASASSPGIVGIFDRKHPPAGRVDKNTRPRRLIVLPSFHSSPPSLNVHFSSSTSCPHRALPPHVLLPLALCPRY